MNCFKLMLTAALLGAAPAAAQSGGFVLRGAKDTIAVERFRWEGGVLYSESVIRVAQARIRYELSLTEQGAPLRLVNKYWSLADDTTAAPRQAATFTFPGDSAIAEIRGGGQTSTQRLQSKAGALPYINPSNAILELVLRRAAAAGFPATIPMFAVAGGQLFDVKVSQIAPDSVVMVMAGGEMRLRVDDQGRILGGRIPAQNLVIDRVASFGGATFASEKPDYSAPAGAPYTAIDVTVSTPMGHTLAGTLTLPQGASASRRVGAIVTITGSGSQDRDEHIPIGKGFRPFREIADSLGRRGIAVLRMDDRGAGSSGGNAATATSADFADDIRAGVAFLRSRPEINPAKVGLLGHSEGGLIAPMVAATDPKLAGIVLMAGPSRPGRGILEFQIRNQFLNDTSLSKAKRDSMVAHVPVMVDSMFRTNKWLSFFGTYDPAATARRVTTPVLILQGATDLQVTADQAEELKAAFREAGNRDVTVKVFPEMNHLFVHDPSGIPSGYASLPSTRVEREVIGMLADWLVRHLR